MNTSPVRRLVTWSVIWLVVVALLVALKASGLEVIDLFKDTIELQEDDRVLPWKGAVGVLGATAWFVAAGAALLAWWTIGRDDSRRPYLLTTAAVLAALGLDDSLVIHDHLVPYFTGSDPSEKIVLAALALLVLGWALRFRERLLASDRVLLAMSALGLGGAFGIDALQSLGLSVAGIGLVEEVSELLGLITLVAWTFVEAQRALVAPDALAPDGDESRARGSG